MSHDAPPPAASASSPFPAATFYASAERLDPERLREQVQDIAAHPLLETLLRTVGGLIAVLNEHRQILAVNDTLLAFLRLGSAQDVFGLRLGEAVGCPHAEEMPGGCGTSRFCRTCGAAVAQVVALHQGRTAERFCAVEAVHGGIRQDCMLRVRAVPLELGGQRLLLLFAEDVTRQQQCALAERSFHHDLNNTLTALLCASETLALGSSAIGGLAQEVHELTLRLVRESELQRRLIAATDPDSFVPVATHVDLETMLNALRAIVGHNPAATGKRIAIAQPVEKIHFTADEALVLRVLVNMMINALEATAVGGEVRFQAERREGALEFRVWNEAPIPPEVALRIFQRNFTTKGSLGRGLGTYSMKLVGERILRGRVSFDSSALDGTTFRFVLPI